MQIIEKMPSERFETICDAGVELVKRLIEVLGEFGLGLEHGSAVIAVAAAGVAKGSQIKPDDVAEMVESVIHMWREEKRDGKSGIVFDPAHRRDDYVAPGRDASREN